MSDSAPDPTPDSAAAPAPTGDGWFDNLRGDLMGGVTAGIVALPLALGFGVASGMENGAAAGLYGAIAVGILAALFGGTPTQVSGPTGPMTVVVAGLVATIVAAGASPELIFLGVILAGAVQIGMGFMRLGKLVHYVPYPVVSGFMSGIGAIIIALQIPVLLGADPVKSPSDALAGVPGFIATAKLAPLLLGLGTVAVVYLSPRITKAVPGTLVALIGMTAVAALTGLNVATIDAIPSGLPSLKLPELSAEALTLVAPAAVVLAVLGAVDSLLTSLVADRVTNTRHDSDKELIGQGLGNMAAGLIGGLPGAGATMRTVVNVQSGGRGRLSGATHGVLLLAVLLGLAPLAQMIPLAVLAGILVTVGIGILDYRGLKDIAKVPRGDAVVMTTVLVLTVVVDLMWAVGVGVVMSALLMVKRLADQLPAQPDESLPAKAEVVSDKVQVLRTQDALFFGNASRLQGALSEPLAAGGSLVLALGKLRFLDQSGAYALADAIQRLRGTGVEVYLAEVQGEPGEVLGRLGVAPGVVPEERIFPTAEAALAALPAPREAGAEEPASATEPSDSEAVEV